MTHGAFALWAAPAFAEPPPVRVQLVAAACPSPSQLAEKLEPLLDAELEISERDSPVDVAIVDRGESFSIAIEGAPREFSDRTRDCIERARQAAVFIALNLEPGAAAHAGAASELRLGLQLSAELAYTTTHDSVAPGPAAGVWLQYRALRVVFSGAILFANEISVHAAEVAGAVKLTRVPVTLAASYQVRFGRFALGPVLGLELDFLRLRGRELERVQTQLRANLGVVAGVDAQLRLSEALSVLARVGLAGFPRAYTLSIDPVGPAGRTPRLWLSASLGFSWQFES